MKMICFDMDGTIADLYAVPPLARQAAGGRCFSLRGSCSHVGYGKTARGAFEVERKRL